MRMKKETLEKRIKMTDELIKRKDFTKALELAGRSRLSGYLITRTTVIQKYNTSKVKLRNVQFREVKNPHFSSAASMKLYLIAEIESLFSRRDSHAQTFPEFLVHPIQ